MNRPIRDVQGAPPWRWWLPAAATLLAATAFAAQDQTKSASGQRSMTEATANFAP